MAKIYAQQNDLPQALYYSTLSCKLNKGNINCYLLLALIYSAKKEIEKSILILESLINENINAPELYLIRAYAEADKFLN